MMLAASALTRRAGLLRHCHRWMLDVFVTGWFLCLVVMARRSGACLRRGTTSRFQRRSIWLLRSASRKPLGRQRARWRVGQFSQTLRVLFVHSDRDTTRHGSQGHVGISRDRLGLRRTSVGIIQDPAGCLGIRQGVRRALPGNLTRSPPRRAQPA